MRKQAGALRIPLFSLPFSLHFAHFAIDKCTPLQHQRQLFALALVFRMQNKED